MEEKLLQYKTIAINELKAVKDGDKFYISGYANNKNIADAYGDIPTNYKGRKVYDLTRMKKNPVMLIDHWNSATKVIGNFVDLLEDDKGLKFKALLRHPDSLAQAELKDAINGYIEGFIRSLSIAGKWLFEDKDNPSHLTRAIIYEISGVAVGADMVALTNTTKPKSFGKQTEKFNKMDSVENLIAEYRKTKKTELIKKIMEEKK